MAPIELDPIPDPVYPDGGKAGAFDASGNIYEAQELLHRPHAFALMHGKNGAKVAYGELHYIVNSFKLKFETKEEATQYAKKNNILFFKLVEH